LCIIAGYKEALDKCFFSYNEGLTRRFIFRYDIPGYSSDELMDMFILKVHENGWFIEFDEESTDDEETKLNKAKIIKKVRGFFAKNKRYFPHYGGDIETFFLSCKIYHSKRVLFKDPSIRKLLTFHDIDNGFKSYIDRRKYKENNDIDDTSKNFLYL
jgi:hypothetical protein